MEMAEEEERCDECGSENVLDTVYFGKMVKLCRSCALTNGAVIIKKPSIEQLTKAEKELSLQERVKAWRRERQAGAPEASLDTLRRRKQELELKEAKRKEELMKKGYESEAIDFRSRELKISDLKKIQQEKQEQKPPQEHIPFKPAPLPLPQPAPPKLEKQDEELEMTNFIQEVQRLKEEDQLEEIVVPVPISEEQAAEDMKKTTGAEKAEGEKV